MSFSGIPLAPCLPDFIVKFSLLVFAAVDVFCIAKMKQSFLIYSEEILRKNEEFQSQNIEAHTEQL